MSSAGKRSRSAIIADTERGHHLLTIHGYSGTKGIPSGRRVKSRPFIIGGHRWCIYYYPNGPSSVSEEHIFLELIPEVDVAGTVQVRWGICLAGEDAEAKQPASLGSVESFIPRRGWSYTTCIKRKDLESDKHLRNDSFTVRCDIVVVHGCRRVVDEHAADFVSVPPCDLRRHLGELLDTEKGADVVFEVAGETVPAHRCVLAARSAVFAAELFGPMKEGRATSGVVVRVEDMEAEVFKALLRFAYTGSLPKMRKGDANVTCQHLLVAADRYGMERLKLVCEDKLCKCIDVGSAATILVLADQHHCEGLKKACFNFLGAPATLRAVMATDGFQHLRQHFPSLMVELMAMSLAH